MPKIFDLLLGIATVMLLLSLVVTALTHYLVGLSNLRGRHLRTGLSSLLARLDPRLGPREALALATAILKDPLISEAGGRMASFVHRAQFTRFCLSLAAEAAGRYPEGMPENDPHSYASPSEALYWALRGHGISHPSAILDRISLHALELEQVHGDLSELARLENAVVSAVPARFVAKINASFDQTMERVSARFTTAVRAVTVATALGLASFFQIDCLALVNHLAMEGRGPRDAAVELLPVTPGHAGGILVTAMLLSLGAPFWYSLLGGALRLRPVLAERDDRDRRRAGKAAPVIPFASISSPASSARLPESGEWRSARENRYNAGRR
jgi:hypothetical protein